MLERVVLAAAWFGLLAGCGGPSPQDAPEGRGDSASPPRPSDATGVETLAELGDYLPPLDDGRIEVAPPKGWHCPPRSHLYVFRAQKSVQERYPRLVVTAEDVGDDVADVSEANVDQFAKQTAAALNKSPSEVLPVVLGDFVGVAYRRRGREEKSVSRIVDLLYLDTVVGGRKYSIVLRTEEGMLEAGKPYLYAVAKGIRFLPSETQAPPRKAEPRDAAAAGLPKVREDVPGQDAGKPEKKPEEEAHGATEKKDGVELDLDKLDALLKQ
jgi:hypothetical protein